MKIRVTKDSDSRGNPLQQDQYDAMRGQINDEEFAVFATAYTCPTGINAWRCKDPKPEYIIMVFKIVSRQDRFFLAEFVQDEAWIRYNENALPISKVQSFRPDYYVWHKSNFYTTFKYGGLRMHKFQYGQGSMQKSRVRFVKSPKLTSQLVYYTENRMKSFRSDVNIIFQNTIQDVQRGEKQGFEVNTIKLTSMVTQWENPYLLWFAGDDNNGQSILIDKYDIIFRYKRPSVVKNYRLRHSLALVPRSWNWAYTFIVHHHPNHGLQVHIQEGKTNWRILMYDKMDVVYFDDVRSYPYKTFVSDMVSNMSWYQASDSITQQQFNNMVIDIRGSDIPQKQDEYTLPACASSRDSQYDPRGSNHHAHYYNITGVGNIKEDEQYPRNTQHPSYLCLNPTTRGSYSQCENPFWWSSARGKNAIDVRKDLNTYEDKRNGENNMNHTMI